MELTLNNIPIKVDPIAAQEVVRRHLLGIIDDIPFTDQQAYAMIATPVNGAIALKRGEKVIGSWAGPDGKTTLSILLPGEKRKVNFDDAGKFIAGLGGERPNRIEGLLLFLHHRDLFEKDDVLWLEQYAEGSSYAWGQGFYYGFQNSWLKDSKIMARAVRRVTL